MASGLDLASGVFAGVSIALQLHQFWNRVEDAPKEMQDILNDLLILKDVLRDIHVQQALIWGSKEVLPTHRPLLNAASPFRSWRFWRRSCKLDKSEGVMKRKWKALRWCFVRIRLFS
jgi:hypothetical protein